MCQPGTAVQTTTNFESQEHLRRKIPQALLAGVHSAKFLLLLHCHGAIGSNRICQRVRPGANSPPRGIQFPGKSRCSIVRQGFPTLRNLIWPLRAGKTDCLWSAIGPDIPVHRPDDIGERGQAGTLIVPAACTPAIMDFGANSIANKASIIPTSVRHAGRVGGKCEYQRAPRADYTASRADRLSPPVTRADARARRVLRGTYQPTRQKRFIRGLTLAPWTRIDIVMTIRVMWMSSSATSSGRPCSMAYMR